jgi:putative membrane protein
MSRKEFDTTYINELINGHEKMLGLMQNELKYGEDPALKAFAARTISIIQMHLYSVERIHDSMK